MSTSEFENEWESQHVDSSLLLRQELGLPEDFTNEDMAFAQEMEALFSPDLEEMPPYYVQTLLDTDNPRFQPVEHGLEYKTSARVFRRLHLRRRLFRVKPVFSLATVWQSSRPQRSIAALLVACCLFALLTVVATGPSFAAGLEVLLAGRHSGVLQVSGYPNLSTKKAVAADIATSSSPKRMSLLEAQQQLEFQIHRPAFMVDHYTLTSTYLYQGIDQSWADGPALELDYSYTRQGIIAHGIGQISVCEFKPKGQVLQIVQLGAARAVQLDRDGHADAIYVDGQWVRVNKFSHDWIYGVRSEIIYEHDGIIFWIVGDQRDSIDQKILLQIANSLHPLDMRAIHMVGNTDDVTVSFDNATWPFTDDIVYAKDPDGSSLEIVSTDMSVTNPHAAPHQPHGRR